VGQRVNYNSSGTVDKRRPHLGEGGLSSADIFWKGEFFRCGHLQFLVQKTSNFLKFMVCRHGQRGVEPLRIFCRQGWRGKFFV